MADDRTQILERIRRGLGRGPLDSAPGRPQLAEPPAMARLPRVERMSAMRARLAAQAATVDIIGALHDVPAAIAAYLGSQGLPLMARLADHPDLTSLDWTSGEAPVETRVGAPDRTDRTGISRAFAGMAETGTLIMFSDATSPTSLCFTPETHIIVLNESEIVAGFEGVWQRTRQASGNAAFPRSLNFISGPSRTADIEQTLYLGAHGPLRLHVVIIEGS